MNQVACTALCCVLFRAVLCHALPYVLCLRPPSAEASPFAPIFVWQGAGRPALQLRSTAGALWCTQTRMEEAGGVRGEGRKRKYVRENIDCHDMKD